MGLGSIVKKVVGGASKLVGGITGGDLLGAGTSLLGGQMQSSDTAKANAQNYAMQKEFAQNSIRWKVEDAKAAGIHPLYALGASPYMASPSFTPGNAGSTFAQVGQDLSRSIHATRTAEERAEALGPMQSLQLENMGLQNDLLRTQIQGSKAAILRQTSNPPMPSMASNRFIEGQGNVALEPSRIVASGSNDPSRQAGAINQYQLTERDRGGYGLVPSEQMKERMDDDFITSVLWHLQHRLVAPPFPEQGYMWNPLTQRYHPNPFTQEGRRRLKW